MAPISAAIVLQERGDGSKKKKKGRRSFFFNFLKNESNLRWTAKGKWTAEQTTVQQLLVEKYRVSNRNIDFPSVFDINIGVDCTIGKQLIL